MTPIGLVVITARRQATSPAGDHQGRLIGAHEIRLNIRGLIVNP
jgi:hypothetical protein